MHSLQLGLLGSLDCKSCMRQARGLQKTGRFACACLQLACRASHEFVRAEQTLRCLNSNLWGVISRERINGSEGKLLGHPIHSMLIVFPLGLPTVAAIFDVI